MAKKHESITPVLSRFIDTQKVFFTASAGALGRVNLSPKGLDGCFAQLAPRRVAFLNLTGSGNETAAHLKLNDRITIVFCAFSGPPMILRLYGRGRAIHPRDADWFEFAPLFKAHPGRRQIVVVEVEEVVTSCGYGVPLMDYAGQRPTLIDWAERKGEEGIRDYWREKNLVSLDGDPTGVFAD